MNNFAEPGPEVLGRISGKAHRPGWHTVLLEGRVVQDPDQPCDSPRGKARHGGHGWMMIVCCIPMLLIAAILVATGAARHLSRFLHDHHTRGIGVLWSPRVFPRKAITAISMLRRQRCRETGEGPEGPAAHQAEGLRCATLEKA